MLRHNSQVRKPTPELHMLWYPHLPAGTLSPEVVDEALRQGRKERAEMMAMMASGVVGLARKGIATLFKGIVIGQERRASAALAQARALMPSAVRELQAAGRGELPGPVCEILSHPESSRDDAESSVRPDNNPRLAA